MCNFFLLLVFLSCLHVWQLVYWSDKDTVKQYFKEERRPTCPRRQWGFKQSLKPPITDAKQALDDYTWEHTINKSHLHYSAHSDALPHEWIIMLHVSHSCWIIWLLCTASPHITYTFFRNGRLYAPCQCYTYRMQRSCFSDFSVVPWHTLNKGAYLLAAGRLPPGFLACIHILNDSMFWSASRVHMQSVPILQ